MQTIISLWIVSIEITSKSNLNETVAQTETFISGYRKIYSAEADLTEDNNSAVVTHMM